MGDRLVFVLSLVLAALILLVYPRPSVLAGLVLGLLVGYLVRDFR